MTRPVFFFDLFPSGSSPSTPPAGRQRFEGSPPPGTWTYSHSRLVVCLAVLVFLVPLSGCGPSDSDAPCVVEEGRVFHSDKALEELESCREVLGDLVIREALDVADLSSLSRLETVSGHLELAQSRVTHLDALRSLRRVGRQLFIHSNGYLTRVDGLSALQSVGDNIVVSDNPSLAAVEGWGALISLPKSLLLDRNKSLARVGGFKRLTEVGGRLRVDSSPGFETLEDMPELITLGEELILTGLDKFKRLSGFGSVKTLGSLRMERDPSLAEIDAFAGVVSVSGLTLVSNTQLVSVTALNEARSFSHVHVNNNPKLSQFNALRVAREVGGLSFEKLPSLTRLETLRELESVTVLVLNELSVTDFEGLPPRIRIGRELTITKNSKLTQLKTSFEWRGTGNTGSSLSRVGIFVTDNPLLRDLDVTGPTTFEGDLWINNNGSLQSLGVLPGLVTLNGALWIQNNERLQSLEALSNLTSVKQLDIKGNASLSTLEGLRSLKRAVEVSLSGNITSLEGLGELFSVRSLNLEGLPRLRTLRGLKKLTLVEGSLFVSDAAITSLSGLEALVRYGRSLGISNCTELERLTGLEALTHPGEYLGAYANPRLPACEAENLFQRLRAKGWSGEGRAYGNSGTGTCP